MLNSHSSRRGPAFALVGQASKLKRSRGSSNALPPIPPQSPSASAVSVVSPVVAHQSMSFQDRLIDALVKRVKQSLPFFSGTDLTAVEPDDSLKQTVETLVEMARTGVALIVRQLVDILIVLNKHDPEKLEHKLLVQVLQSQLLVLKILDLCVTFHWHSHRERYLGIGYPLNGSASSLSSNAPYAQGNHPSTIAHSVGMPWVDPPAVEGSLARSALDTVSILLSRCATAGGGDLSFHDFEVVEASATLAPGDSPNSSTTSLPKDPPKSSMQGSTTAPTATGSVAGSSTGSSRSKAPPDPFAVHYKPFALRPTFITMAQQPQALSTLVSKFAGRIVFFLSASNWSTVYAAVRQQLFSLANVHDPHEISHIDLTHFRLIANSALDRKKLVQVLGDVGSLMYNVKRPLQVNMAASIGTAIWNWIDVFPEDYREASQTTKALSGAPERVFDAYYQILDEHNRAQLWPALSALLSISPERIRQAEGSRGGFTSLFNRSSSRKPQHFLENVARGLMHTRTLEASISSYNALCRAAIHIPPQSGNVAIRALAPDLAEAIRTRMMSPNPPLKGFHETIESIDLAVMSDAMVTIYRFNPHSALQTVFLPCLAPNRSDGVKCCVVRALIKLATESGRLQWQTPLTFLYSDITPILRDLFGTLACRKKEIDATGRAVFKAQLPRIRQDGQTSDRDLLMLAIMSLWRLDLGFFFYGITEDQTRVFVREGGQMLLRKESTMLRMSGARTFGGLFQFALSFQPGDECYEGGIFYLTAGMPITLSFASDMFMKNPELSALQLLAVNQMSAVIPQYANPMIEDIGGWKSSPIRVPSFAAAELCLLIALASYNMDQTSLAASNLRFLAEAEMLTADSLPPPAYLTAEELNLRWYAYKQLADPEATITGRLANQKRIRKLLQNIAFVNGINIMAWEEGYKRWLSLLHVIRVPKDMSKRNMTPEGDMRTMDDLTAEWQHIGFFLAAFGSCCMTDLSASEIELPKLPPEFLIGRQYINQSPKDMMRQFIGNVRELLVSDVPVVRETAREIFGSELHPSCFVLLIPQIDKAISAFIQPSGKLEWDPARVLFIDQLLSMFKLLVERTDAPQHATGVDGGVIMTIFVNFVAQADNSEAAFRLKMKLFYLTEVVFAKRDMFPIRQESQLRRELIEKFFDWIATVQSMTAEGSLARLYIDFEIGGLRAAARLLENQTLGSLESRGHDSDNTASILFYRYFSILMTALGREETASDGPSARSITSSVRGRRTSSDVAIVKKLVIDALVNMLVANSTVGPKYCLTLGFHEDITRRTVFAEVFSRLVRQGTKFDTSKPVDKVTPRMQLCNHLKSSTPLLALAICEVCPDSEIENMVSVMLRIFCTRKSSVSLLKAVIDQELHSSNNSMGVFRGSSIRVKLMTTFAKNQCEEFLRKLINPIVEQMATVPDAQYETDPIKAGNYILDDNVANLEVITQMFLDNLFNSQQLIPGVIRELCNHIYKAMADESPELQILPVISFIFLRVISPGLALPESIGVDLPTDSQAIQRGLILIAKTIQTLANNTRLSVKSDSANVMAMMQFCQSLVSETGVEMDDPVISVPYDESDGIMLHRFLHMHSDKVARELRSLPAFSVLDEDLSRRTNAWDTVSSLLLEIGSPMEAPHLAAHGAREQSAYRDFLQRNANRNMDSVKDIFVKLYAAKGGKATFGLFMSRINIETDDMELLMLHILKSLTNINLSKGPFEVIVDCSGFTASSEVPISWWLSFLPLIPDELINRASRIFIVNANIAAQRFLRKLYNLCWGMTCPTAIFAVTSWVDLKPEIPNLDIDNVSKTSAMDTEPRQKFTDVEFHQVPEPPLPVTFELAASHIRIISKRPQQIWPGLACKFTEIITLEEVGELLSISASGEDEFVMRPQHGRPSYLSSKETPRIVNAVRSATGRLKQYQPALPKEIVRVEATTATLINVALVNMSHRDNELRLSMLNLVHDVTNFLGLREMLLLPPEGSFVPSNPFALANDFSKRLASHFPELTLDFLQEFSTSLGKYELEQRPTAVQHVNAWVRNLALFCNPAGPHFDASGAKLKDTLRMLLEMTVKHDEVYGIIQRHVWVEIGRLDIDAINCVIDELVFSATTSGIGSRTCEVVADTFVSLASIHVRGKLLARLRKAFNKESILNAKQLSDDGAWHQLAALTRLTLVACHHGRFPYQIQLFVPELVHAMTLVACQGPLLLRTSLHSMACNMIQALNVARGDDPESSRLLGEILHEFLTESVSVLFGIQRPGEGEDYEPTRIDAETHIASVEGLTTRFQRIIMTAATSETLANVWQARWMSLISSSATFMWPAIQCRAFHAFSCLATCDVEDDFLAQMLTCFRDAMSLGRNVDLVQIAILLRALSKMVPILNHNSVYLPQIFWVAFGVIASTSDVLYPEATRLMEAVILELDNQGVFEDDGMVAVLLQAREPVMESITQVEDMFTLSLDSSFSFSLVSVIFRGVRNGALRPSAESLLKMLLRVNARTMRPMRANPDGMYRPIDQHSLALFVALLSFSTTSETFSSLLETADVAPGWTEAARNRPPTAMPVIPLDMLGVNEVRTAVLLSAFIVSTLPNANGNAVERDMLYKLLGEIGTSYPQVVALACKHTLNSFGSADDNISSIFASSSSQSMASALTLLRLSLYEFGTGSSSIGSMNPMGAYAPSLVDSLGDSISLQSNTEMGTLLETYSMDGILTISTSLLTESSSTYTKVLQVVADMVTAMLS